MGRKDLESTIPQPPATGEVSVTVAPEQTDPHSQPTLIGAGTTETMHEIGEHEGKPYFSLEFCPGGSLACLLALAGLFLKGRWRPAAASNPRAS